jgi:hypothetical protein
MQQPFGVPRMSLVPLFLSGSFAIALLFFALPPLCFTVIVLIRCRIMLTINIDSDEAKGAVLELCRSERVCGMALEILKLVRDLLAVDLRSVIRKLLKSLPELFFSKYPISRPSSLFFRNIQRKINVSKVKNVAKMVNFT